MADSSMQISQVNNSQATVGKTATAQKAKESANCVFDADKKNNTYQNPENKTVTEAIDKLLSKICEKYSKYGLTVEQLKNNPFIQDICHIKEESLKEISESDRQKALKAYEEALETAINESIKDGKIDIENVSKLTNDYFTALSTGWSIKGFKEAQLNKKTKHSLMQRLVASGCLPKGSNINNTSPEKLKAAIEKFYTRVLVNDLKNTRYKRKENGHEAGQLLSQEDRAAEQLRTFGRLLINSSPEEKEYFVDAIKHLYNENKLKGIKAVFLNSPSEKQRQNIAAKIADPSNIKDIVSTADPNGETLKEEESAKLYSTAVSYLSKKDVELNEEKLNEAHKDWFKQNGEALKVAQNKVNKAIADGVEPNLTDEEKQLLVEYNNFVKGTQVGQFFGINDNENLTSMEKEALMSKANRDNYELPSYKDVLKGVDNYIKKYSEELSPEYKEQFTRAMDKATNNNFTAVKNGGDDVKLTPPSKRSEDSASSNADLGFSTRKPVDTTILEDKKQKYVLAQENKEETFRVDKRVTKPVNRSADEKMQEQFTSANTNQDKLTLITRYFDKSTALKNALEQYVVGLTNPLNIVNSLPISARSYLSHKLVQKNTFDESDIKKLNLSYSEKQMLISEYREIQKINGEIA